MCVCVQQVRHTAQSAKVDGVEIHTYMTPDDDVFYLFLQKEKIIRGYMALELFFVSARTNKRHHHHQENF